MPKPMKGVAKRYPLNMRTTKETREKIEEAAAASGRSLVQEVEMRLEQSFLYETYLGGRDLQVLAFRLVGAFNTAGTSVSDGKRLSEWRLDKIAYAGAARAVVRALLIDFPVDEFSEDETGPRKFIAGEIAAEISPFLKNRESNNAR